MGQKDFVDWLNTCCYEERLSSNVDNLRIVDDFKCDKNPEMAHHLQDKANEDDLNGADAHYVIKDEKGTIIFYYSLRCGSLYDTILDGRLKADDTLNLIHAPAKAVNHDPNDKGVRVQNIFSGVEMSHFCANSECSKSIKEKFSINSFGDLIFWTKILPKVIDVNLSLGIGCEYFFLFAKDLTQDTKLISYYKTELRLRDSNIEDKLSNQSQYADMCVLLCRKVTELAELRDGILKNLDSMLDEV